MKRDIHNLLKRWGNWVRSEEACRSIDWLVISPIIAISSPRHYGPSLSDSDGIIVDSAIAALARTGKTDEMMAICMYYIAGCNLRKIADNFGVSNNTAHRMIERAENFIEGSLSWLNVRLECDAR